MKKFILKALAADVFGGRTCRAEREVPLPPRYYYSVWLRHLVLGCANGLAAVPRTVIELGPGDSLGMGLAAVLSGACEYHGLDAVPWAARESQVAVLEELIALFQARADIPDDSEFPKIWPQLRSYEFPHRLLTDECLGRILAEERLRHLREAVAALDGEARGDLRVRYCAPWNAGAVDKGSADMVCSQAVLEHLDDIEEAYRTFNAWLRPGGWMSHTIAFLSLGTADKWNGHWAYSDFEWRLLRGRQPYLINREPHSPHVCAMRNSGFQIVSDLQQRAPSELSRKKLARRFGNVSEDDLTTKACFVQAVKKTQAGNPEAK